jgi:DNA mismatch repair protein MSH6
MPRGTLSSATSRVLRDCTRHPLINELSPGDIWDSDVYSGLKSPKENAVAEEELLPTVLRHVKALGEKGEMAVTAFGACVQYLRQVLLDRTLLAVRRIELLPGFNAILDDPECKALMEQAKVGVGAALHKIEPHMVLDGAALENLEVLENCDGGTNG